eukprot:1015705-Rhodomonas_salina.1
MINAANDALPLHFTRALAGSKSPCLRQETSARPGFCAPFGRRCLPQQHLTSQARRTPKTCASTHNRKRTDDRDVGPELKAAEHAPEDSAVDDDRRLLARVFRRRRLPVQSRCVQVLPEVVHEHKFRLNPDLQLASHVCAQADAVVQALQAICDLFSSGRSQSQTSVSLRLLATWRAARWDGIEPWKPTQKCVSETQARAAAGASVQSRVGEQNRTLLRLFSGGAMRRTEGSPMSGSSRICCSSAEIIEIGISWMTVIIGVLW